MKIGDYCRTKDGFIAKLIEKDTWYKFDSVILEEEYPYNYLSREHAKELIVKSSPNIIDLIEVGDYVNGYLVEFVDKDDKMLICFGATLDNEDIESIVTHEQFESMEYRIGE